VVVTGGGSGLGAAYARRFARAGANGEFVATIGTTNSDSGGNSRAPDAMIRADLRPTKISSRAEAMGLVGGGANGFPVGRVAEAAGIISALKLGKVTETQATKDLVQCGFTKTTAALNTLVTPASLDPNVDPILQSIFPGTELTQNGDFRKAAAAMKVVINGYGGAGTIEYGGRDYHQNPRPDTDNKDFVVGQVIGAALEGSGVQASGMWPSPANRPEVGSSPIQPAPGK